MLGQAPTPRCLMSWGTPHITCDSDQKYYDSMATSVAAAESQDPRSPARDPTGSAGSYKVRGIRGIAEFAEL